MNQLKSAALKAAICLLAAVCVQPVSTGAGEIPEGSQYLPALQEIGLPTSEGPAGPFLPRWNFSGGSEYHLKWRQESQTRLEIFSAPPEKRKTTLRSASSQGNVVLKGHGGFADLILKDQRTRIEFSSEGGEPPKTIEQAFPPSVLQGMGEDGTLPILRDRDLAYRLLFRLPPRALDRGQTVEVPVRIPFEVSGSLLQVGGLLRMTLTDFVELAGRPCARLDVQIDISDVDLPVEIPSRCLFEAHGASTLFFDIEHGRLLSGRIALRLKTTAEAPVPSTIVDGLPRTDRPERTGTEADVDTLIIVEST